MSIVRMADPARESDHSKRPGDLVTNSPIRPESSIALRPGFSEYPERDVHRAAVLIGLFGINAMGDIKLPRQKHLGYFEGDMRKIAYVEVNIPLSLQNFTAFFPICAILFGPIN